VLVYLRRFFEDELVVVLNLTPEPRRDYRIGVPQPGVWREILCSDEGTFGGSGHYRHGRAVSEAVAHHGEAQSLSLVLPPLCALVLEREPDG
jgi:1,4-alpha-glucan branching enzyme